MIMWKQMQIHTHGMRRLNSATNKEISTFFKVKQLLSSHLVDSISTVLPE